MCHVQPLSTTNPILRCPLRRRRLCRAALRRALVANMARAGVAIGAETTRGREGAASDSAGIAAGR
eukprot:3875219-Pleurochrysis_carterae.AAC.3